tara:strand:+ start:155 stop:277 length:123 start_codon:yes stop_codon:yes gene_type:complete
MPNKAAKVRKRERLKRKEAIAEYKANKRRERKNARRENGK